jgi:hypothetical protein
VREQLTKVKMVSALVAMLAVMVVGAPPAFAEATEIAVTGVVEAQQNKADGTPVYGIKDKSTSSRISPQGYLLEGDYSAYVGKRVTVYGTPHTKGEVRVLDVSKIEQ